MEESNIDFVNSEEVLENKNPAFLINLYEDGLLFTAHYGWHCLIGFIALLIIYMKFQPHIEKYLKKKREKEYDAKYHKNSDLYRDRIIAMEKARQKMQQELDQASENYKEKLKEKEERRREIILQQAEGKLGHRLGNRKADLEKKSLRSDYNPLMGSGGSSYKAPKKSGCPGGGCGKK